MVRQACKIFSGREDVLVINLLTEDVEFVINQILSCEKCISSSLHGLVVCHSYELPCLHVTFSDRDIQSGLKEFEIGGDGVKFRDYFSSVCIPEYYPAMITQAKDIDKLHHLIPSNCGDLDQIPKIIKCCPFLNDSEARACM